MSKGRADKSTQAPKGERTLSAIEDDPQVAELRRLYGALEAEPLPDDLLALLKKLDEVERGR